jgi:predicted component of type VI protein secretion system
MKQLYLLFCLLIIISCEKDKSLNTPPKILQLNFEGVKSISTNIDSSSKIITVEVPYQTSISALVPIIGLEDGVTVVPASGLAQNFAQDV